MSKSNSKLKDDEMTKSVRACKPRPATSIEEEENELIELAINAAKKQLKEGTASAQVITHYLKLGSTKERTEKQKIEKEIELLEAKAESLKSAKKQEEFYIKAVEAFKTYTPSDHGGDDF